MFGKGIDTSSEMPKLLTGKLQEDVAVIVYGDGEYALLFVDKIEERGLLDPEKNECK